MLPAELQAHIAIRAAQKFGAGIADAKAKKQKTSGKRLTKAPLHVNPQQLQLAAGSFVSESGQGLCQLSFEEVSAHACGICFVDAQQAAPFLKDGRSLSVEALAIVTTAELPPEACGKARVSFVRYPAVFAPTKEAVLVSGSLVQLGDDTVQLALDDVVGAESDPPAPAMPLADGFVLIHRAYQAPVCSSTRTLKHLQQGETATEVDPWFGGQDPWSAARSSRDAAKLSLVSQPTATKLDRLETGLKQEMKSMVQQELAERGTADVSQAQEARFQKLEVGFQELRQI